MKDKPISDMPIQIASYIETLLHEHHSVIIPGFGGFVSSYRPATIDYVQGLLHPPSKNLDFNDNLLVNDGVLINYLIGRHQLNEEKAKEEIDQYVTKTKAALEQREIILFPGVGRLYKNYEGKLQFLQDSTNFNGDAFGLPAVNFYPILRNKEVAPSEAPIPHESKPRINASKESKLARVLQTTLPILMGMAIMALGMTFYLFQTQENRIAEALPQRLPVSEKLINKRPSDINRASIGVVETDRNQTDEVVDLEEEALEEEFKAFEEEYTKMDTESMTLGPNQKEGIIIVGAFAYPYARKRMVDKIIDLGYDVYQEKLKNSTRLGVQFVYEDDKELKGVLKDIKKKIDDRAWVLKKKK